MTYQVEEIIGKTAYDSQHNKVGTVQDIYEDQNSHEPTWMTVSTGFMGAKQTFVPLSLAHATDDELIIETSKDAIDDAPKVSVNDELTVDDEQILYKYYEAVVGSQA